MKTLILFALAQILGTAYSEDVSVYDVTNGKITMIGLGAVDGKGYFVDDTTRLNWTSSRTLCQQYGLKLATITTEAQFAFLKSKYNATTFSNYYWIGARDSTKVSALAWDETNLEVGPLPTGILWRHHGPLYQLCGAYRNNGGSDQYILSYDCSMVSSVVGTLCET